MKMSIQEKVIDEHFQLNYSENLKCCQLSEKLFIPKCVCEYSWHNSIKNKKINSNKTTESSVFNFLLFISAL